MSQQVQDVAFFSTEGVDTPYPLFLKEGLQETPMLRAMQLFAHLQQNYVPVAVERTPVSTYVTIDNSRQTVSLLFINKSAVSQQALVGPQQNLLPITAWPALTINLAPYSIVEITMQRNSGAEAYSFVTANQSATTPAISQTQCGQRNINQNNEVVC